MTVLRLACLEMWEAKPLCGAWGAPSPHGCKFLPGHDGPCRCLCGNRKLSTSLPASFCGCCGQQTYREALWCAQCNKRGHLLPPRPGLDLWDRTWFAQFGQHCPHDVVS
mgnify:CR=1 FL=1